MEFEIWLIRHAESEFDPIRGKYKGGRMYPIEITPKGIIQASKLRHYLKSDNISFDRVIVSPAVRAQQTARYGIPQGFELSMNLLEQEQGLWEGLPRKFVYSRKNLKLINKDPFNFTPPKGESQSDLFKRSLSVIHDIVAKAKNNDKICLVTHGIVIQVLLTRILNLHFPVHKFPINNTSISILRYFDGNFSLIKRNDTTHLGQ